MSGGGGGEDGDGQAILTRQPCFDVTQSGWTGMDWTGCASGRVEVPNVNKVRLVREYLSLSLSLIFKRMSRSVHRYK